MISASKLLLALFIAKQAVGSAALFEDHQTVLNQCTGSAPEVQTYRERFIAEVFRPESTFQTYGNGIDIPSSFVKNSLMETAVTIVQDKLGLKDGDVSYTSGYSSETSDYAYLAQTHRNIPFVNAIANLVLKEGRIVSFGSSFVKTDSIASPHPSVRAEIAIRTAERAFNGVYNRHPTKIQYLVLPDSSVALVYVIQVQNDDIDLWQEVYVDAHTGEVHSATDFVSESGYEVVPVGRQSVLQGLLYQEDPEDKQSSPLGWHNDGKTSTSHDTSGNNVIAFINNQDKTTRESASGLQFKYIYDTTKDPKDAANPDAARVNAFYVINKIHDIAYRYGFTEKAFNFQSNNFGKGGAENDRVLMWVQNGNGKNNANFAAPPDGQSGTCKMFLWDLNKMPMRDGDLDNSVIIHEMTHGISNRMTGGGTGRCLQSVESKGLGEGWSDTMANWIEQNSTYTRDYTVGSYAMGNESGTRRFPYSTDPEINPLRFQHLNQVQAGGQHQAGQIWANILHNVYATLVKKHGFSSTAKTNPNGKEGNVLFLHLMLDALAIQPCYPRFVDARDAWIQADQNRYNGANKCLLWKAFVSRGLGMNAKGTPPYADGEDVPADCA
ncbi:unnamed protein product [Cyclocybe aegerita]|uniref:Extracellular metalloproteinase n=1 Tax=Cyclocybe aegerita TaxID=1973307 RepID=A0A8S0VRG7_CYCAE|nr:unnamed protein product [Cyclocybe aegerita]